ncbi:MAG: hypothetical protein AAF851_19905 [Myxococcota bacterium]
MFERATWGVQPRDATLAYRRHHAGGTLGEMGSIMVDLSGLANIDFSTGAVVERSGCNWDLAVLPTSSMELNANCGVGSFPLDRGSPGAAVLR